jgi:hypothetical protein
MKIVNNYHKPQLHNSDFSPGMESLVYGEVKIYLTSLHVIINKLLLILQVKRRWAPFSNLKYKFVCG